MRPVFPAVRQSRTGVLAAVLALLALAGCDADEPHRPNLLILSVDTLRADRLGLYGYEKPTSPHLDVFAQRSVVFERAISPTGWTLPALASFMTSAYSSTHGCWFFTSMLDPSFPTLAEVLRDAGYDTAAVASHVYQGMRHGLHQGFTHYDDELVRSEQEWKDAVNSPQVSDKGVWWIEEKAAAGEGPPWMLWLHYFDPHYKYIAHEPWTETMGQASESERYDTEVAFTDHHLGRVLDALERTGLAEETVVVFFSDHGEEFYEHGTIGHSHSLYQELLHVPLLIRAPGLAPRRVDEVVRTIDVMPTLLELLDVAPAGPDQGRSLVPLMSGEASPPLPAVAELRVNWEKPMDSIVLGDWKLIVQRDPESGEPLATQLYDLTSDPGETRDLAAELPERREQLLALLGREVERAKAEAERYDVATGDPGSSPAELRALGDLGYAEHP